MPVVLIIIFICGICLSMCAPDIKKENKTNYNDTYGACRTSWKDSGYKFRLVPYQKDNFGHIYYTCQVNANGHWVPEDNVKVG
jgi:hypothetical protein